MPLSPEELGYDGPAPSPPDPTAPPVGLGRFAVPQVFTFQGVVNALNHVYPATFDEAQLHSRENADRMRSDPVIGGSLRLRMMAVALLTSHIEPDDPTDPAEVQAADDADRKLGHIRGLLNMKRSLLDATFIGRAGWQNRWRWSFDKTGRQWMTPGPAGRPIDGDKLVFDYADNVGVLVHAGSTGLTTRQTERGPAYFLSPDEREQVVVHKFEPTDAPFYRPQLSGAIHGLGLRNALYWLWALKSRIWSLSVDYLEWFAQGLTAYYFESGNAAHMKEVADWVKAQQGRKVLMFPRTKDGGPGFKPIERFEAGTASSAFLQNLITGYFDDLIRQLILGQTLTSGTAPTGLGSGVASAHQQTFDQIVKYDAMLLDETLTSDLVAVFYRHNYPGMAPGRWVSDVDSPNAQQMIENAQAIWNMGGRVSEDALVEAASLPEPGPNDTLLSNVQPMQPAAVDGMPEGVPVVSGTPDGSGGAEAAIPADPNQQQGPVQLSRRRQQLLDEALIRVLTWGIPVTPGARRLSRGRSARR